MVFIFLSNSSSFAEGVNKNTKKYLITQALKEEQHKNHKSAIFNYEKLLFYYPNDETAIRSYAKFCEKIYDYDKAISLYQKLLDLTHDMDYAKKITDLKNQAIQPGELTGEDLMYRAIEDKDLLTAKGYLEELLNKEPNNKKYLKLKSDIAIYEKNYPTAIECLTKLRENEGRDKYLEDLAYCYFQTNKYDEVIMITDIGLNSDPNSEKWLKLKGDMYARKKDYKTATEIYTKLIEKHPKPEYILNETNLLLEDDKYLEAQILIEKIYNSPAKNRDIAEKYLQILHAEHKIQEAYIVAKDNHLLDTATGTIVQADMAVGIKDYSLARSIYDSILVKSAYDEFAQMSLTHNYISTSSNLRAIKELNELEPSQETQFLKAKAYYNMEMYEESANILKNLKQTERVLAQENDIQSHRAFTSSSCYDLYLQKLNEEYKLNANKFGISNSCYEKNMQFFVDYIANIYYSGRYKVQPDRTLENFTNEIRMGAQGRVNEKFGVKGDFGVKIFENSGAMAITDSWIKYYLNDSVNFKFGVQRNNVEQTYLSAVGRYVDNNFTGQAADNTVYLDATIRLPKNGYMFTKGGIGYITAQNMPNNIYWEGMFGIGKLLRYDFSRPYLQKISIDFVSYNAGYQTNLLNLYDSKGFLYGGYYSPEWFSSNTINMNFSGRIKNTNLSYGYGGFGGTQYAYKPTDVIFIWGASVYLSYKVNDHISLNSQYRYYKYAEVIRNQWSINLIVKFFSPFKKK